MESVVDQNTPLGQFPFGSHDSWQFHFYLFELATFVSVRLWASGSVQQAWAWTSSLDGSEQNVLAYLKKCTFDSTTGTGTRAQQTGSDQWFQFTEKSNTVHDGILRVGDSTGDLLNIEFTPGSVFFWGVPNRPEGVFHFPNIAARVTINGQTVDAVGYCKRYWGVYGPEWGYQFIQGAAEDKSKFFWTADATFQRDEYNYFKVYTPSTGEVISADKTDTWHRERQAFWRPVGADNMDVQITVVAKMEFILESDQQFSRLTERFGPVVLRKNGEVVFSGFGFNEVCFGTVV